jgi:hypothetical protein
MRKAQFIKFRTTAKPDTALVLKNYFKNTIDMDRNYIVKVLKEAIGEDYSQLVGKKEFDLEITPLLNVLKEHKEGKATITTDYTYNMAYVNEYEHVTYYELVLPYIKKKNMGI